METDRGTYAVVDISDKIKVHARESTLNNESDTSSDSSEQEKF